MTGRDPDVRRDLGAGTSWHPHHIAERSGLLSIISLGEGVVGTVLAVAIPVGGYIALVCALYTLMVHTWAVRHLLLMVLTAVVLVADVLTALARWWVFGTRRIPHR